MTTWNVLVDWDRDFEFEDADESLWDDVIALKWSVGMGRPYQLVADETSCTITLRNEAGKYTPENPSSPLFGKLLPQRMVKITATVGETEYIMWRGWVDSIKPQWETAGGATGKTPVVIKCSGAKQLLQDTELALPLQENKRGDQIVKQVLRRVVLPPTVGSAWILGHQVYSVLGDSTLLVGENSYSDLEAGDLTFAFYGDVRESSQVTSPDAYKIIKEITEAERGHFFFSREGKAVWWNRSHFLDAIADDGVLDSSGVSGERPHDLRYEYGKSVINTVRVAAYPRELVETVTVWRLDSSIIVQAGEQVEFEATYTDANGRRNGATNVVASGVTFSSGTATVSVKELSDRAKITINNTGSVAAVLSAMSLTGDVLSSQNTLIAEARDAGSIEVYGKRQQLKLNLRALDNFADAYEIGRYELERHKDPRGEVDQLVLLNQADGVDNLNQLMWTVGARLRVVLPEFAHDRGYLVIGEEHVVSRGGRLHQTTYTLENCVINRLAAVDGALQTDAFSLARSSELIDTYASANQDSHIGLNQALVVTSYASGNQDTDVPLRDSGSNYDKIAQSFTLSAATPIYALFFSLKKAGSPNGTLTFRIETDNSGSPSGTLAHANLTANLPESSGSITTSYSSGGIGFTPAYLAAGTYWGVISTTRSASPTNIIYVGADASSPSYSGGVLAVQNGGVWSSPGMDAAVFQINEAFNKLAQSLTLNGGRVVDKLSLWLKKVGSPSGTLTLRIETDSSGSPSGTLAHTSATATFDVASLSTSYGWITFDFTDFALSAGSYWLVLSTSSIVNNANYVAWGADGSSPSYSGGQMMAYAATWHALSKDACFELYAPANAKLAQSFTSLSSPMTLQRVRLWLKKIGAPSGNLSLKLQSNSSGSPSGTIVEDGTSQTVAASTLTSGFDWVEFRFDSPPLLAANSLYWLVLETTDSASSSNYVVWGSEGSASYVDGQLKAYAGSWFALNEDACIEVYGMV